MFNLSCLGQMNLGQDFLRQFSPLSSVGQNNSCIRDDEGWHARDKALN